MCGEEHESWAWRDQTWEKGKGWACPKWYTVKPLASLTDFASDDVKEGRIKHAKDMIQRWSPDNQLSKEFVETYPEQVKGMIEKGVVSKEQVRKSKYTYKKDMKGLDQLPHEGAAAVLGKE